MTYAEALVQATKVPWKVSSETGSVYVVDPIEYEYPIGPWPYKDVVKNIMIGDKTISEHIVEIHNNSLLLTDENKSI